MHQRMRIAGVAAGVPLFALAGTAGAQSVTQTLTIQFVALGLAEPVPLGGWLPALAAGALAVAAAVVLRRRGFGRLSAWVLAAVGCGALLLDGTPVSEAGIFTTPLALMTSPASVQFTFPGAPPSNLVIATDNNLGAIQITNITLSGGPYIIAPLALAASKNLDPKFVGPPPCFVGQRLNKGADCSILLEIPT